MGQDCRVEPSCILACRRFIILEADAAVTPWSRICISHADCVLLVGAEEASPQVISSIDTLSDARHRVLRQGWAVSSWAADAVLEKQSAVLFSLQRHDNVPVAYF